MRYFDLHCDTATELFARKDRLRENRLHISLERAKNIEKYIQVAAFWSDPTYTDGECYSRFLSAYSYFISELRANGLDYITDARGLDSGGNPSFILGIEGANLLENDLTRIDRLYSMGIRIITPVWKGVSCIGGAFDADEGLTPFGFDACTRMGELKICCDLSHAGIKTAREALSNAKKNCFPVLCSHSNSFSLCTHRRCISDAFAKDLAEAGGICAVSFVPKHLTDGDICNAETVASHILHLRNVAGSDFCAVGSDFDGVGSLPDGINGIQDIGVLAGSLSSHGLSDDDIDKIMFENARRFFLRSLGG